MQLVDNKLVYAWKVHGRFRGEGGYLATGVSWHKGRNTHWQRRIAAISNLYSTVASPVNGQQASVLCELRLKRGLVFYFVHRSQYFSITIKCFVFEVWLQLHVTLYYPLMVPVLTNIWARENCRLLLCLRMIQSKTQKGGSGADRPTQRGACWLSASTCPLSVSNLLVNCFTNLIF
jgi:hypothetical protein